MAHGGEPHTLTEFAPLNTEEKKSSGLLSWLLNRNKDGSQNSSPTLSRQSSQVSLETPKEFSNDSQIEGALEVDAGTQATEDTRVVWNETTRSGTPTRPANMMQTRTLSSVLKRLSNILDRRSTTPQAYKDSDFKQYWMPDNNCRECYECGDKFNTFRRRHHCRICGQIFCSRCCNQEVPGKIMGYTGDLRVCTYCCKVVLSYAQQADQSGDLGTLREDLKSLTSAESDSGGYHEFSRWTPGPGPRRNRSFKQREEEIAARISRRSSDSSSNMFDITPRTEQPSLQDIKEERKLLIEDSAQLKSIWQLLIHVTDGMEFSSHRYRLRTYPNCIIGSAFVDWLIKADKAATRVQAVAIGQALVDAKWLECVSLNQQIFKDEYVLYRPGEASQKDSPQEMEAPEVVVEHDYEPEWFKEIQPNEDSISMNEDNFLSSSDQTDSAKMDHGKSTFYLDSPLAGCSNEVTDSKELDEKTEESDSGAERLDTSNQSRTSDPNLGLHEDFLKGALFISKVGIISEKNEHSSWRIKELPDDNEDKIAFNCFSKAHREHLTTLCKQMLSQEGLSLTWSDLLIKYVFRVSELVKPDVRHDGDDMDIRQYVQIKKIPGGNKTDTRIHNGVVCTKHVAHKKMAQVMSSPRILLLKSAIEYQRVEQKFSSLEPQMLQEHEFLRNSIAKIATLKPDILLVEKTVSRLAQQFLLDAQITLVLNVKPTVMERVARFTQADIVSSIDGLVSRPRLGLCKTFRVHTHALHNGHFKTLMYFEGCASHLGCTITLRGAPLQELKRVKPILQFLTFQAYSSRQELSFMIEEFAQCPQPPEESALNIDGLSSSSSPESPKKGKKIWAEDDSAKKMEHAKMKNDTENKKTESDMNSKKCDLSGIKETDVDDKNETKQESGTVSTVKSQTSLPSESAVKGGRKMSPRVSRDGLDGMKDDEKVLTRQNSNLVTDFSDPLHNYQQNQDDSVFNTSSQKLRTIPEKRSKIFRKTLDDLVLSGSPFLKYEVPYLETEAGSQCILRHYFPEDIYWSPLLCADKGNWLRNRHWDVEQKQDGRHLDIPRAPPHRFVHERLIWPIDDKRTQALLADFRARGGCIIPYHFNKHHERQEAHSAGQEETSEQVNSHTQIWERRIDCLNPIFHQRLAVLFSSYSYISANAPNPCVSPWTVTMDFYGRNDITLGGFLERYCFRESYYCPNEICETPMIDHIRRFVHENGSIQIVLRKLEAIIPGFTNNILMWSWCRKCKKVTPVVPMSSDTWSLSFAKYLELRFHGSVYTRRGVSDTCQHSLHHDFYQYFGFKQTIASFKYSPITLREIALPPDTITVSENTGCWDEIAFGWLGAQHRVNKLQNTVQLLSVQGFKAFNDILEHLHKLQSETQSDKQANVIQEHMMHQQEDKAKFREKIDQVQTRIFCDDVQSKPLTDADMMEIQDAVIALKRLVAEAVVNWNTKIQGFKDQQKKIEKSKSTAQLKVQKEPTPRNSTDASPQPSAAAVSQPIKWQMGAAPLEETQNEDQTGPQVPQTGLLPPVDSGNGLSKMVTETRQDTTENINLSGVTVESNSFENSYTYSITPGMNAGIASQGGSMLPGNESEGFVVCNKVSSEPDKAEKATSPPMKQTAAVIKTHKRSQSADLMKSVDFTDRPLQGVKQGVGVKNIIASFLTSGGGPTLIQMPFPEDEHYLLPPCTKIPIVVYDREPSSVIAYALSSADYKRKLVELKQLMQSQNNEQPSTEKGSPKSNKRKDRSSGGQVQVIQEPKSQMSESGAQKSSVAGMLSGFLRRDTEKSKSSFTESVRYIASENDQDNSTGKRKDELDETDFFIDMSEKTKGPKFHIELQFSDNSAKFYCQVYYADQFRKLRQLVFPDGEELYIRSLSRCINWKARGGKSGSLFCKTQNDRFIVKQMSQPEVKSFLEFAPRYIEYINSCLTEKKPTALAKILGFYRIGYRNASTNTALRQDLLVMENLFYDRKITQIFDLKGSMRNRLAKTANQREEELVLLDENLLKSSLDSPLYIRPHSKTVLTLAINNDTQFLSSHLVMDYSLLVGMDESRKEVVVGIIDYIRTFTWDKKLEMVVKASGILGGQGKMPTVVSPELYRTRFLEAMDRYFLLVPDRWSKLGQGIDN